MVHIGVPNNFYNNGVMCLVNIIVVPSKIQNRI
jgi:hypothetical protein